MICDTTDVVAELPLEKVAHFFAAQTWLTLEYITLQLGDADVWSEEN